MNERMNEWMSSSMIYHFDKYQNMLNHIGNKSIYSPNNNNDKIKYIPSIS